MLPLALLLCSSMVRTHVVEFTAHTRGTTDLAISMDSASIASVGLDGVLALWSPEDGSLRWRSDAATDELYAVCISSKSRLAAAGFDRCVRVHDLETGEVVREFRDLPSWVVELAFDQSGELLVAGSAKGSVWAFGVESGELAWEFASAGMVDGLAFHPSGDTLAIAGGRMDLVDAKQGKSLRTFTGHSGRVSALAFSADGSRLASASFDKTARLWNPQTGDCLQVFSSAVHVADYLGVVAKPGAPSSTMSLPLTGITFAADGTTIGVAGAARVIEWWRPDGTAAGLTAGHTQSITALETAADGSFFASGGLDGRIRVVWP